MEKLLNVKEAAEILGVKPSWIYGNVHQGTLPFPAVYVGRYLRFKQSDVQAYIETQTRAASAS